MLLTYKAPTVSQLFSGHVRGEWHIRHMSHSGSLLDAGCMSSVVTLHSLWQEAQSASGHF